MGGRGNSGTRNYRSPFKDGDTPKTLDRDGYYKITKISEYENIPDEDYGTMIGSDAQLVLKGFHYEEILEGDGMWYKRGASYGFDVRRIQ